MLKFTLDTNCLIDIEEKRLSAQYVERLLEASRMCKIDLAMVASSASERQLGGGFLDSFELFRSRMDDLGFGHVPLLQPLLRWGVGFWGYGIYASEEMKKREQLTYNALFPNSPAEWSDYCAKAEVNTEDKRSKAYFRWRNQILDTQAYWAHEYHERDVFVTSDRGFERLVGHNNFPKAVVRTPELAIEFLEGTSG